MAAPVVSLVVTFMADDKPGLVSLLSKTVSTHGGNWLESSLSRLGGKFTGILVVQVPAEQVEALTQALTSLRSEGINLICEASQPEAISTDHTEVVLDLVGHDKPGIVRDISSVLAQHNANVIELSSELVPGSMSSELLFKAQGRVTVPVQVDMDQLQDALEAIASDLLVDISFN